MSRIPGDPADRERGTAAARELTERRDAVDAALAVFLDEELAGLPESVADAIRYPVLSPGKRVRPLLLMAAYRATGGERDTIVDLAMSVELVHAYSLVHDDLPCMDDDVLRRGRPTVHVRFGVPVAVLAGASLMPLAVRAILRAGPPLGLDEARVNSLVSTLADAAGAAGMVGGQLLDLRAEGRRITREELERIHSGKTARLIAASAVMGGIAAGADPATSRTLRRFGLNLGLAFQAVDDILDLRGTAGELGKESGRDEALGKATYPSVCGLEAAERISREFADRAVSDLDALDRPEGLRAIAEYIIERSH